MKRIFLFFVCLFCSATAPISFAEALPDSSRLSKTQQQEAKLYEIKLQLLSNPKVQENKKDASGPYVDDRVTILYEKLTELYCMPNLYLSLKYEGDPSDEKCLNYMTKLESHYPDSPVLQCAKFGIDSDECKKAYNKVYFGVFDSDVSPEEVSLTAKVDMELAGQKRSLLNNELYKIKNELNNIDGNDKENLQQKKQELQKIYSQLLDLECKTAITRLVHTKPHGFQSFESLTSTHKRKFNKTLTNLIEGFNHTFAGDEKKEAQVKQKPDVSQIKEYEPFAPKNSREKKVKKLVQPTWRIRLISEDCNELIEDVSSQYPNLPAIVCAKYGNLTPKCIGAWRELKEKLIRERKKTKQPAEANKVFKTF